MIRSCVRGQWSAAASSSSSRSRQRGRTRSKTESARIQEEGDCWRRLRRPCAVPSPFPPAARRRHSKSAGALIGFVIQLGSACSRPSCCTGAGRRMQYGRRGVTAASYARPNTTPQASIAFIRPTDGDNHRRPNRISSTPTRLCSVLCVGQFFSDCELRESTAFVVGRQNWRAPDCASPAAQPRSLVHSLSLFHPSPIVRPSS